MRQHPQPAAADAGGGVKNNPPPLPAPGNRSLPHRQQQQQQSSPALFATIARSLALGMAKCEMRASPAVHVTLTLGRTRAEECPSFPVNARQQTVGCGGGVKLQLSEERTEEA